VCVCMYVCVRERDRKREKVDDRNKKTRTYDLCQSLRSFGHGSSKLLIYKVRQNAVSTST